LEPAQTKKLKKGKKYKILIIILSTILFLLLSLILITHFSIKTYPNKIKTSEKFCIEGHFLLPNLYKTETTLLIKKEIIEPKILFNKYPIYSNQICFTPTTLIPETEKYGISLSYLKPFNISIFEKVINLETKEYPKVKNFLFEDEINLNQVLTYQLNDKDSMLEYDLLFNETVANCSKSEEFVVCDTTNFNFEYEKEYELSLVSKYENSIIKTLDTQIVSILNPVEIVDSSIESKDTILNPNVEEVEISLNKDIIPTANIVLKDSEENSFGINTRYDLKNIYIKPLEGFKQGETYFLQINNLYGVDNSQLREEYVLEFSVANGPEISGSNIKDGFSTSSNIVLTFNQTLDRNQNIKNYITLNSGTNYSYSIYNKSITINPSSNLSFCSNQSLKVIGGIKSNTGLVSSKNYNYSFKTTCRRGYSIGTSVEGRGIYAYYFGTGNKKILFYAAMHGTEANTKSTLNYWMSELEKNFSQIPSDKTVIVVPVLNPDGITNESRFNANGVDINRNFGSSTWTSGTYFLSQYYPNGGGLSPFCEPETRAIRDLIIRENPYITLSYHSAAGYVIPSNTSRGIELGNLYSSLSGYRYVAPGTQGAFTYDITGAFGEWAQEHGYNSLTVELSSAYYNQFTQNRNAMWEMVKR
jgi:hypothetical protein